MLESEEGCLVTTGSVTSLTHHTLVETIAQVGDTSSLVRTRAFIAHQMQFQWCCLLLHFVICTSKIVPKGLHLKLLQKERGGTNPSGAISEHDQLHPV